MSDQAAAIDERAPFSFVGDMGPLFGLVVVNALLTIVTLGIYRFWARTRVRRFLWRNMRLLGEPFEYSGVGSELFVGFLIVVFIVLLPLGIVNALAQFLIQGDVGAILFNMAYYLVILFLIGVGLYRARRYRLTRTTWRGIRANQTGAGKQYAIRYVGYTILQGITLGWFTPAKNVRLWDFRLANTWFGNARFKYARGGEGLYRTFAICWFLLIPTLGISFLWYKARELRTLTAKTSYEKTQFELDVTAGRLAWLVIPNALITIFTVGLGAPFAQWRTARFLAIYLRARGTPDFSAIEQDLRARPQFGEGLADGFNLGGV
ncbi:MAG: DUF898 domain-containing protein [Proteobacteria bacterium]|nr:DUF898 domain-containing protein [Pseudomonadota bacterium]MCH8188315.1 DUF898 domain-containing protein [Pseudomonadota bacterium]